MIALAGAVFGPEAALWVYSSSQIFFFGAEFTRLYALQHGSLRRQRKSALRAGNSYKQRAA